MATIPSKAFSPLAAAGNLWPRSTIMQSLNIMVDEIAKTDIAVLLIGESGTGKEVYARLIHRVSNLSSMPMKKVNCAATDAGRLLAQIRESLGAVGGNGYGEPQTLFLDGVDELDLSCQRVLLSLLSDSEQKCGSGEAAVRFISSSPSDLEKDIEAGRFRRELYFRINGVVLRLPPLRERKEDIPDLLEYLLAKHAGELKKPVPVMDGHALELLTSYNWPGNIRELENVARKIVALGDPTLALGDLRAGPATLPSLSETPPRFSPLKVAARAASRRTEKELILQALERTRWNRKRAARELQISYKSLLYKIKQIGVHGAKSQEP
jgi:two-component system, NtrC family, response regulator AtoC